LRDSLNRLQTDRIDCLALHGINTPEHLVWIQKPDGCMAAVRAAQKAGIIDHVGFSTHGSRELIEAAIATDQFAFVNLHYYYFFPRHRPLIDLAQQRDMGVFIISPADKGGQLYTHQTPSKPFASPTIPCCLPTVGC
jgi:predicted aldo/keto reductase-like oxidoreductase